MDIGPSEPAPKLPWGPKLDQGQRMLVVQLGGHAVRCAYGNLADQPDEESLRELLAITRDPLVWGVVLGQALASLDLELGSLNARIVGWCREAGADEDAAETHQRWLVTQPRAMRPL